MDRLIIHVLGTIQAGEGTLAGGEASTHEANLSSAILAGLVAYGALLHFLFVARSLGSALVRGCQWAGGWTAVVSTAILDAIGGLSQVLTAGSLFMRGCSERSPDAIEVT